jgi:membrane associated rhomboid family serine protease
VFPIKDNIPTDRFPVVTVAIMVINVLVYLFFQDAIDSSFLNTPDEANVIEYGAIPYEFTHPGDECVVRGSALQCGVQAEQAPTGLTAFTSMFMHGGLLHIGGNMLFLWIFGNNVEDSMGPVRFVAFYIGSGLAALFAQIVVNPDAAVPTIGASGAVAGVLGGYLLLFPRARVLTVVFIIFFFTIIEIPALLFLFIWFAQQALFGYLDLVTPAGQGGGVAYFAHIGGFVFGLLMRAMVVGVALAFTALLGFLTLFVLFEDGITVLSVLSLLVVALFFFGIFGALGRPPDR